MNPHWPSSVLYPVDFSEPCASDLRFVVKVARQTAQITRCSSAVSLTPPASLKATTGRVSWALLLCPGVCPI
jgi:hypothetical protein